MIRVRYAADEGRQRDRRRRRIQLTLGDATYHVTQQEAARLVRELSKRLRRNVP